MERQKVEKLKKVVLDLEAGETPERMNLQTDGPDIEFVFGIGREGMSPLEYELLGKAPGEAVLKEIARREADTFFEHITMPLARLFAQRERCWLRMTIRSVDDASPREIVHAMAVAAQSGCDCGCGCSS